MMDGSPVAALVVGLVGASASAAAAVVGAATGTDFAPWASGGAGAVAVGALSLVVRDFRSGKIVAFEVADHVKRLEKALEDAQEREDAYRIWIGTHR